MRKVIWAGVLAGVCSPVSAMEIGPLTTGDDAGEWGVGVHYYHGRSQWDTGSDLADDMIGDVTQKGVYLTADYLIHPRIELHGAYGGFSYDTTPEYPGARTDSAMDTMFSLGLSGTVLKTDDVSVGPFFRYTRYADYELEGSVVNDGPSTDFQVDTRKWRKLSTGLMVQHHSEPADIYYGLYHSSHHIDIDGTYGSDNVDLTASEDRDIGWFIGALWPVDDRFDITMEFNHISDSAVSVGVNYRFQPTRVVTKTQIVKETVYLVPEPPSGPAVEERTVLFREGSAEVEKGYWGEVRAFAEFMKRYKDTEAFIGGHCDCVGSEEANMELSQRRGDAVKEMLVALYGIDPERIHVLAMGESIPAVEPDEVYGRRENRRAVLVGRAYGEY